MNAWHSVWGADVLDDPGPAGGAADNPGRAVPVQPPAVSLEDGPLSALAGGQINRAGGVWRKRHGHHLAALAGDHQSPVAALDGLSLDVGADGLGYAQPVERQERDERMLARRAEPCRYQQRARFVTIQPVA